MFNFNKGIESIVLGTFGVTVIDIALIIILNSNGASLMIPTVLMTIIGIVSWEILMNGLSKFKFTMGGLGVPVLAITACALQTAAVSFALPSQLSLFIWCIIGLMMMSSVSKLNVLAEDEDE
jgi:hypothetical protein